MTPPSAAPPRSRSGCCQRTQATWKPRVRCTVPGGRQACRLLQEAAETYGPCCAWGGRGPGPGASSACQPSSSAAHAWAPPASPGTTHRSPLPPLRCISTSLSPLAAPGALLPVAGTEETYRFQQQDIVAAVEVGAASKAFDLSLPQLGPYGLRFSRNGRFMLLGGAKGHLAMTEWQHGRLTCEVQVGVAATGGGARAAQLQPPSHAGCPGGVAPAPSPCPPPSLAARHTGRRPSHRPAAACLPARARTLSRAGP